MNTAKPSYAARSGMLVTLSGTIVMPAWWVQTPWLAAAFHHGIAVVFSTRLVFALAGIAVALPALRNGRQAPRFSASSWKSSRKPACIGPFSRVLAGSAIGDHDE
jgi:hypothetical protein